MSDKDIAKVLLYKKVNWVLYYQTLHPQYIINIVKDFLSSNGCRSRADYEMMIRYIFANDGFNRDILLNS